MRQVLLVHQVDGDLAVDVLVRVGCNIVADASADADHALLNCIAGLGQRDLEGAV